MAELCKNNRGKFGCQNFVDDEGVDDSGYCETCHWPGIVEANQKYEQLLTQGYSRVQAAEHSGLSEGEQHHHKHFGTTPITTVEQDLHDRPLEGDEEEEEEAEEEEAAEQAGINRVLDQIEKDNAADD